MPRHKKKKAICHVESQREDRCSEPDESAPTSRGGRSHKGRRKHRADRHGRRANRWCFTINFKSRENAWEGEKLPPIGPPVRYRIYQVETGDTGTVHFQGYLECKPASTLAELKRLCGFDRAHFERARGTREENAAYCSKEEGRVAGPYIEGNPISQQGKRSDLLRLKAVIDGGGRDRDLADESFGSYIRYHKGLDRYRNVVYGDRKDKPLVLVYFGPAGSGKTRRASEACSEETYFKNPNRWWDGYQGEKVVVWDDFSGEQISFRELLRIIDRYPYRGEVKGGFVNVNPDVIIFTADCHPKDWYPEHSCPYEQLGRRIDFIVRFDYQPGEKPPVPLESTNQGFQLTVPGPSARAPSVPEPEHSPTPPTPILISSDEEDYMSSIARKRCRTGALTLPKAKKTKSAKGKEEDFESTPSSFGSSLDDYDSQPDESDEFDDCQDDGDESDDMFCD